MKLAFNIQPRYLIAATVTLGALMIVSAYWELDQSRRELYHVVHEEALSLVETIHQGSVNTILATGQVEEVLTDRLLNNARLIATLDSAGLLTRSRLVHIAETNHLFRINIFDRLGRKIRSNHIPEEGHAGRDSRVVPEDMVAPILRSEAAELVFGLKPARYEDGQRFAVAVRRTHPDGGAIVVNLDAAELLAFRKRIGIGKLIRDLGDNNGIVYVALQDAEGIIAASGAVQELSSFSADTLLHYVMLHDTTLMREATFVDTEVYEVLHPLVLEHTKAGVLRIGLSMDEVRATESRMQRRLIIISLVLLVVASLVSLLIVAGKNYRRVEQELQRAEKLTALGELASGVAHEIRNPLNAIAMIAQRFEREFVPRRGTREFRALTTVLRAEAQRVNGIIQQFLRFARPPRLQLEQAELEPFLRHVATLFEGQAAAKEVAFTVEQQCEGSMLVDKNQLTQAVWNLLLNALEATPQGGKITLACRNVENHLHIVVTDTGHGIPSDALQSVFNLYYTTKPDGTGMGLPMAQQIVAQHQGRLEVSSTPGRGSRFSIILPKP